MKSLRLTKVLALVSWALRPKNRMTEKQTVAWTLRDLGDGKVNPHLDQSGFANTQGLDGAKYGWGHWFGKLEQAMEQ